MKISYYPGCSLHGTAQEYDHSLKSVCAALGIELQELEDWNCCGASSAHSTNEKLSVLLPARNLMIAEKTKSHSLLVPCSACYNRLKASHKFYQEDGTLQSLIPYNGTIEIKHVNEFFADPNILIRIRDKISMPLKNFKVVPYYGCLTVRHPKVIQHPNPEDPTEMDDVLKVLGAQLMSWSYKTDCCGGSLMMARTDIVKRLSGRLFEAALDAEADAIVTCCPLCQANLDTREHEIAGQGSSTYTIPVFYITELIGVAIGCKGSEKWWEKHMVSPKKVLQSIGLNRE